MQRTYELGGLRLTALSDGPIELPTGFNFYIGDGISNTATEALNALRSAPATFSQNPLLVDSPVSGRTLIDAGVGQHLLLNSSRFGLSSGHMADHLAMEGIDPHSVDRILISHLHPDHCWGLIRPNGTATFPHARLHLHVDELAHWTRLNEIDVATPPIDTRRHLGAILAVQPYYDRLETFAGESQIANDIHAVPFVGHTPGHTAYRFTTSAEDLLSWGDCFHNTAQVTHPSISAVTDAGTNNGAQRSALLDELNGTHTRVHAYHFPYPGLGTIERNGVAGYRWHQLND